MKISSIVAALVGLLMVLTLNACGDGKSDSGGEQQNNAQCAANQILNNGQCQACPANQSVVGNQCVLQCAANQSIQNGQCVTLTPQCSGNQIAQNGVCVACLEAQVPNAERTMCIDNQGQCERTEIEQNGLCVACPAGQFASNNRCTAPPAPPLNCTANQIIQNDTCVDCAANEMVSNNMCVPIPVTCGPLQIEVNNMCVDCGALQEVQNNMCVDCAPGQILTNNMCADPNNTAPVVDAGNPQTIQLPTNMVTMTGSATDDGNPFPANLAVNWTSSDPGNTAFADASNPTTAVTFGSFGTYTLTLSANDGQLSASDTVVIRVDTQPNNPPTVAPTASPSIHTLPGATSSLAGNANDDGVPGPLSFMWSSSPSSGVTITGSTSQNASVTFTQPGTFTLTFNADDGDRNTSGNVSITVNPIVCAAGQRLVGAVCLTVITNAGQCSNAPLPNHTARPPSCSDCHGDGRTCTVPAGFVYP